MNETWFVEHSNGSAVLRRHRSTNLEEVQFEHKVIEHVRTAGIPVPMLLRARNGTSIVQHDGRLYTLYSLEPGEQPTAESRV